MDTPKREVAWLESFPPDIWAYFVSYLSGEQLGRLMITGATLLWQRLMSPHVVKSITHMFSSAYKAQFCGPPGEPNLSYFPPQLTYLRISDFQLSPETAKLLPPSLTFLEISNLCERVCQHLPNGLKTLKSNGTLMSTNLIKFLPRSLTSLQMSLPQAWDHWFEHNTGKKIDSILKHSEFFIHQECVSSGYEWEDSLLPPTLTSIGLSFDELGDSFILPQQLPNLLELGFGQAQHFTDTCIPFLSPHLKILCLSSSSKISSKSFRFLPRGLSSLFLSSSQSIFDSDLRHLPRTLECISFNNAIHLTDLCVPDLPRHLKTFKIDFNSKITPSSFPKFPYPLRSQKNGFVQFLNWSIRHGEIYGSNGGKIVVSKTERVKRKDS